MASAGVNQPARTNLNLDQAFIASLYPCSCVGSSLKPSVASAGSIAESLVVSGGGMLFDGKGRLAFCIGDEWGKFLESRFPSTGDI